MQINLGYAPSVGRTGLDQCQDFKAAMWRRIGRNHDGAFLKTLHEDKRLGMAVEYDSCVEGALEWADRAKGLSDKVWDEVKRAREVGARIIIRRGMK